MKLGLCVVGCGAFARTFSQAMQSLRDEIDLFFASRDVERARSYAATFNGREFFGSYEAAAVDPRVQAMYLCTPHHLHREHATLAAGAGKHILVEKPMARTLEEAREMLDPGGGQGDAGRGSPGRGYPDGGRELPVPGASAAEQAADRPGPPWVEVSGTRGRLYFEVGTPRLKIDDGTSERTIQLPDDHYGIVPMVREFHDGIVEGREPQMSGAAGLADLEVVLKAHESMEQGISLPLA